MFNQYSVQALIDDPGIGGYGLNGTNLIGVSREFSDLTEALQLVSCMVKNPMTTMLQFIGQSEGSPDVTLYVQGIEVITATTDEQYREVLDQVSAAVETTDLPTGYRVAYTDRYDGQVERRCRFFDTEEQARAFAEEYYDLNNPYYGINRGFCRPEHLPVAVGPRAWDMTMAGSGSDWEVSFPEESYKDAFQIPDPHQEQFQYGNIRHTHCVAGEISEDGMLSIPVGALQF